MKNFTLILLFIPTLFCTQEKIISEEDSVKIQKEIEIQKRIKDYKDRCKIDSLKAAHDSKIQNKYYINLAAPAGDDFPADKEINELLIKHNIVWGGTWMGSDLAGYYTNNSCYYVYMINFTEEKFGKEFIDKLVKQSLLNHIEKNPSVIFEYNDHLDWIYEGEYSLADKLLNKYFFTKFKYPKNYKYSSVDNQNFTEVELEVDDNSYIIMLAGFKHHLSKNKEFIPYFEKSIRQFIESSNFIISERNYNYHGAKKSFKIYYK